MFNFGPTFIFTILNLLILYFILKKALFKPVTEFMDKRTNSIKESIDSAEKNKAEALELKRKYEEQLKAARQEADRIINEARDRAGREYADITSAARQDAEAIKIKAREEIEREKAETMIEIRNKAAVLAVAAASRIIEANMDSEKNRVLAAKFIDEAGAA